MPSKREAQQLTQEALERHLWEAAALLRGSLASNDYRNYIFGFLLLKRLSDRFEEESEILLQEGGDPEESDEHQFFVPAEARWQLLQRSANAIGERLNRAAAALEDSNPVLQGMLTGIDFNDAWKLGANRQRDDILSQLVRHFSQIVLRDDNLSQPGLLGRTYEHLIEQFASAAGKKGGEFATPPQIGRLMTEILRPSAGMRICDPACGSGGLLIQCAEYVSRHGENCQDLSLFGQERNLDTLALCRMNLLLHGLPDARIEKGDTIREPRFLESNGLMSFDIVISNPPAALANWGWETAVIDPWGRFQFGIPPRGRGDYAFLQHMIAILSPHGRMAVLIPQVALSREGPELQIRRGLVESDLLEAVVGLPPGILYATNVAPAIIFLNRAKPIDRREKVLFVDASKPPTIPSNAVSLYAADYWNKIITTVQEFSHELDFSRAATLEEIATQGFNLQSGRYHSSAMSGERLGRIAEIHQGRGRSALGTGRGELPVVQGRDLGVRQLSRDDLARWPAPRDPARAVAAREGDILLQRIGRSPKAMVVGRDLEGALVSDTVYVIRLREEHRSKAPYLVGFLNSATGQRRLAPAQAVAVIPTLNLRVIRGLGLPLPSPAAVELFERVRSVEDDLLARVQQALELRSKLFAAGDSEALEIEMRRLGIDAELLKQSIVHAEDPDFQIRNFYPHVIAYGYRRLSSVMDDQELYREQLGLLETLLVFLGSLGIALATALLKSSDLEAHQLGKQDLEKLWEGGVSAGQWVSVCRVTAALLRRPTTASAAAGAFAAMWTAKLERTFGKLVQIRNDQAHGRGPHTRQQVRKTVEEFGALLRESIRASLFLPQHPIRLVHGLTVPWGETGAIHKTLIYKGDHPSLQREDIRYHTPLTQGHLYMELEPDSWLPLYPLLSVEEATNEICTFAIDRFDKRRRRVDLRRLGQGMIASAEHTATVGKDISTWLNGVFGPK